MIIKKTAIPWMIAGIVTVGALGTGMYLSTREQPLLANKQFFEDGRYILTHRDGTEFQRIEAKGNCYLGFKIPLRINERRLEGFYMGDYDCDGTANQFFQNTTPNHSTVDSTPEQREQASIILRQYMKELDVTSVNRDWKQWRKIHDPSLEDMAAQRKLSTPQ